MKRNISFSVNIRLTLLFIVGFAVGSVIDAAAQTSCIDYKTVGMADCAPAEENPEPPAPSSPTPEEQQKSAMDKKVDDYLEYYDKPPREFIEFNVNPTLDNAVKWAHKYQEIMQRNKKLTAAWAQAQALYKQMQAEGADLPELDNPLPEIPDYGLPVPSGFGGLADLNHNVSNTTSIPKSGNITANNDEAPLSPAAISTETTPLQGNSIVPAPREGVISINYYFSAEDPYSQKFEPEFQQIIAEMGDQLDVTCVDVTPSGADPRNIRGKVDCRWRPMLLEEMDIYGVKSTPTLIISRDGKDKLERLSGYVSGETLKRYLLTGEKN